MVMPTAARMIQSTTPMKLATRDLVATFSSSPCLPEKTQNVTKPKIGIKKLKMYTNHWTAPIMHVLSINYHDNKRAGSEKVSVYIRN
jgi:hypothetical protein